MTKADIITMLIFLPIFAAIFSACLARDIDQDVESSTKTYIPHGLAEGQTETVEIVRLITPGTIDERIADVLGGKIDVQKLVLDEIGGKKT